MFRLTYIIIELIRKIIIVILTCKVICFIKMSLIRLNENGTFYTLIIYYFKTKILYNNNIIKSI